MSWEDIKWLASRHKKTLYEMWKHEFVIYAHEVLLELYKWDHLCEKGGEVLLKYFSQKINGDKFCLVVEWIFILRFDNLAINELLIYMRLKNMIITHG